MMRLAFSTPRVRLYHGDHDHADVCSVLAPESIDAIVTDPPSGIEFMGKSWDSDKGGRDKWIAWLAGIMRRAMVVLKPGGHALVWALPRTSHWTATAVEDAGFEIRDVVMHLFGSGFPKSLDVSKAIDGDGGAKWSGWGTALKPAAEHWILARKPLSGTVAGNVLAFGTGALNVDGCRIGTSKNVPASAGTVGNAVYGAGLGAAASGATGSGFDPTVGRWPAHLTLDEDAAAALDEQTCDLHGAGFAQPPQVKWSEQAPSVFGAIGSGPNGARYGDAGGASRFFYVAKPARSEKDAGLDHLPLRTGGDATDREEGSAGLNSPRSGAGRGGGVRNHHPTVKSIELMRWLCRLITPPGGTVLDLFTGSGTTGLAALREGFSFVGFERDPEFIDVAAGRLAHVECVAPPAPIAPDAERVEPAQPSLFAAVAR